MIEQIEPLADELLDLVQHAMTAEQERKVSRAIWAKARELRAARPRMPARRLVDDYDRPIVRVRDLLDGLDGRR